jgi:methionyl aminopeptidase
MTIAIKTEQQVEAIRKSCQLAVDALDHAEQFIQPGISTEEIDREIETYIRKFGGIPAPLGYHGYPKSSCTSINEVICHGIPKKDDILKEGDIIKVDVSTIVNGYFGDTCRTFPVGKISDQAQMLLSATRDCLDIGISQVRPNNEFGMIGRAISAYARLRGYGVVYEFTGHGTGLKFHEEPVIAHDDSKYDYRKMEAGMIFTIEPMINLGIAKAIIDESDRWTARTADGSLSAQFEHTILVTESGSEVLTK